jgi:hypothetical protein
MTDQQILQKAYTEMPNFKTKLDETMINTPFKINKTNE